MSDALGIYVHWPYCASICPYCDFNVRRDRGGDYGALLDAIITDLCGHAALVAPRRAQSLYLGGGTPSLLAAADVARLIDAVAETFGFEPDAEITLEANPEHRERFADLVAAGINRLSLGVQSLAAPALLQLGRRHSVREGVAAVEAAAKTGARVSVDLIYARGGQSTEDWRAELRDALNLPIEHISLYELTIEAGTAFARAVARGRLNPPDAEQAAALYETTQEICEAAGFPAYEISNHARTQAAQSRHSLLYWRGEEWIGIGPGAHGRITIDGARRATQAHQDPGAYCEAVQQGGLGWASAEALSAMQIGDEYVLMGLRLAEGIERARAERLRGRPFAQARLNALLAAGLLDADERRIRLPPEGRLLADRIAAELAGD
jgi:oxygen-independent coproporphyrinogen-3 oxidase